MIGTPTGGVNKGGNGSQYPPLTKPINESTISLPCEGGSSSAICWVSFYVGEEVLFTHTRERTARALRLRGEVLLTWEEVLRFSTPGGEDTQSLA